MVSFVRSVRERGDRLVARLRGGADHAIIILLGTDQATVVELDLVRRKKTAFPALLAVVMAQHGSFVIFQITHTAFDTCPFFEARDRERIMYRSCNNVSNFMRWAEDSSSPPPRVVEHSQPLLMVVRDLGQCVAERPTEPKREFVLEP